MKNHYDIKKGVVKIVLHSPHIERLIMKEFELWLDESGDFDKDDANRYKKPSLVGGVLVEKNSPLYKSVKKFIPESFYHATENPDAQENFKRFEKIVNSVRQNDNDRIVIFSNNK